MVCLYLVGSLLQLNPANLTVSMTFITSIGVSFSTDAIDSAIPSNQNHLSALSSTSTALGFNISLRACSAGEAFSETGA